MRKLCNENQKTLLKEICFKENKQIRSVRPIIPSKAFRKFFGIKELFIKSEVLTLYLKHQKIMVIIIMAMAC